jgi:hypothetical protein
MIEQVEEIRAESQTLPSPILNVFPNVRSTFFCGGPMMQLRGESP